MKTMNMLCVCAVVVLGACSGSKKEAGGERTGDPYVVDGLTYGPTGPSCRGLAGDECQGEDCCANILVEGGTFLMGRSADGPDAYPAASDLNADEQRASATPEVTVTVGSFYLDKYEVTVGRFRKFIQARHWYPTDGAGAVYGVESTGWNNFQWLLASTMDEMQNILTCHGAYQTWDSENNRVHDHLPMNCVAWFYAQAFCIWDGGRLPTEAEWEYAAAGGDENRAYPWGNEAPDCDRASMAGCEGDILPVGSKPAGAGRWGHLDLAGNLQEWVMDTYDASRFNDPEAEGTNPVTSTFGYWKMDRGGAWFGTAGALRSASRHRAHSRNGFPSSGFRCAYPVSQTTP